MNPAEAMRYLQTRGLPVPVFTDVDQVLPLGGLSFPIHALVTEEMSPEAGVSLWMAARAHATATGLVPVLLGAESMAEFDTCTGDALLARIRRHHHAAGKLSRERALVRMRERLAERFSAQVVDQLEGSMQRLNPVWLVHGDDPPSGAAWQFLADPEPVRCVLLACKPWEVPLYIGLGGQGAPSAAEQSVVLHGWFERYGTHIVHVGRSVLATHSDRPPDRIDELRHLLWEVFLYCGDAVFADVDDSFAELRSMLGGEGWSFWWDANT